MLAVKADRLQRVGVGSARGGRAGANPISAVCDVAASSFLRTRAAAAEALLPAEGNAQAADDEQQLEGESEGVRVWWGVGQCSKIESHAPSPLSRVWRWMAAIPNLFSPTASVTLHGATSSSAGTAPAAQP